MCGLLRCGEAKLAAMTVAGSVGSGRATSATMSSWPSLWLARGPFGKSKLDQC